MDTEIRLESHLKEVMDSFKEVARERMLEAVQVVRDKVNETLSQPGHGKVYKVPGTSVEYTASAPGEPPATATGNLKKSVHWSVEGEGADIVGRVGTDQDYGKSLEYGTSKMAPRPWLRKSFEQEEGKVKQIFEKPWFEEN